LVESGGLEFHCDGIDNLMWQSSFRSSIFSTRRDAPHAMRRLPRTRPPGCAPIASLGLSHYRNIDAKSVPDRSIPQPGMLRDAPDV